jgi:hypothetical protein
LGRGTARYAGVLAPKRIKEVNWIIPLSFGCLGVGDEMNQPEKVIEKRLLEILEQRPHEITIYRTKSPDKKTMADLLNGHKWDKYHDTSDWNRLKHLMQDVSGGTCPDVVIYSKRTDENRIYIEVKATEPLGYGIEDLQIIRYFLHLLITTKKVSSKGEPDIPRAVILCAPSQWFKDQKTAKSWNYFLEHFSGLADAFNITLGEIHSDDF